MGHHKTEKSLNLLFPAKTRFFQKCTDWNEMEYFPLKSMITDHLTILPYCRYL